MAEVICVKEAFTSITSLLNCPLTKTHRRTTVLVWPEAHSTDSHTGEHLRRIHRTWPKWGFPHSDQRYNNRLHVPGSYSDHLDILKQDSQNFSSGKLSALLKRNSLSGRHPRWTQQSLVLLEQEISVLSLGVKAVSERLRFQSSEEELSIE